ncbi:MAG: RNA-binding transcriptional accessory protein [Calditrichaeota bacterium]|nr:MAG: RNA-binding transcriptional accessory protein [Calditrichota bacterium]
MNDAAMFQRIAEELGLNPLQVKNTVALLDDAKTVPFIARYRKEHTGSLDEEQIRAIEERMHYLRAMEARRETILHSIEEQGKLTPELKARIEAAEKMQELEDLYLPYKPKKRTRATVAREKGLEPLAEMLCGRRTTELNDPIALAETFVDAEKEVPDANAALQGARDIIAEWASEDADIRNDIREATFRDGLLISEARKVEGRTPFEMYYEFSEPVSKIVPHRILALNRGEKEQVLRVSVATDEAAMLHLMEKRFMPDVPASFSEIVREALTDSYKRLIGPSMEREVRNALTEKADEHAIEIFAKNLKNLLLQPPVRGKKIIGIDPGFRTGCKVAVIDETGKYLEGATIYPHPPQNQYLKAKSDVRRMVEKYDADIIAIGNGTASRETEQMVAELISDVKAERQLEYIIVSEAGASVYSASRVAREEFPDLEASMRGNISIARRLQDPLAELVKIDPKSIGVGLYQHDVNQKRLSESLAHVVESCVNAVGVNLNTASASLLRHISGLTSRTAQNIVKYRDQHGKFVNRQQLKQVEGIGEIAFEQAAGFLRIPDGDNPLDNTSIHPESYEATQKLLAKFHIDDINGSGSVLRLKLKTFKENLNTLLEELGIGEPTFRDIITNLEKPGLDPRDNLPKPILKSDVLKAEDLKEGMWLKGTVRNVVDFGAFVDIGVKQDGLVHVSQMAARYVKNPLEVVAVGDIVNVKVVSIDLERGRIGLSMKKD